jgi:hypothetical protein
MVSLQVLPRSQLIFPSKTWFFGIYLNFQWQKSLKNQYLPHSKSKSYQINSIKSCSSRSFQQHQRHIPIPPKFQLWSNLIFSEKVIQYSRTFASQVQTLLLSCLWLLVACGSHWFHLCGFIVVKSFKKFHYLGLLLHYFVVCFVPTLFHCSLKLLERSSLFSCGFYVFLHVSSLLCVIVFQSF